MQRAKLHGLFGRMYHSRFQFGEFRMIIFLMIPRAPGPSPQVRWLDPLIPPQPSCQEVGQEPWGINTSNTPALPRTNQVLGLEDRHMTPPMGVVMCGIVPFPESPNHPPKTMFQ